MLFRFGPVHRAVGWLLTLFGVIVLIAGGRGYITGAPVRPGWVIGGLIAIVGGTALVRWARRARPE
ncbi:MAG TPA: hypothetical protein VE282_03160 [Gemmatimonadales bacterium]|jgi:hypothetical protein|nr:hypothetical protein [Gemmatimonadales bacterium]